MKTGRLELKEIWDGFFSIVGETNDYLYVSHHRSIIQVHKNNFSYSVVVPDLYECRYKFLELNGGLVFHNRRTLSYADRDGRTTELGRDIVVVCAAGDDIIAYSSEYEGPYFVQRITLTGEVVWKREMEMQEYKEHDGVLYFKQKNSKLCKLALDTGEVELMLDFIEYFGAFTFFNILTFFDNTIICSTTGLVGIDLHSGKIKYAAKTWINKPDNDVVWPAIFRFLPSIYKDKLYLLENQAMISFDLHQQTSKHLTSFTQGPDGVKVIVMESTLYGDKIYYTGRNPDASHWELENNRFGVFDIEKQEIIWQTVLPIPEKTRLHRKPVICDNYVYVNDMDDKLYIFERL